MQISGTSRYPYLLYVLTVSGVAYLLKIRNISLYVSCSIVSASELIELDVHSYSNHTAITAVTAAAGWFVIGRSDGSVCCFQLGELDPGAPGTILQSLFLSYCLYHGSCFPFIYWPNLHFIWKLSFLECHSSWCKLDWVFI